MSNGHLFGGRFAPVVTRRTSEQPEYFDIVKDMFGSAVQRQPAVEETVEELKRELNQVRENHLEKTRRYQEDIDKLQRQVQYKDDMLNQSVAKASQLDMALKHASKIIQEKNEEIKEEQERHIEQTRKYQEDVASLREEVRSTRKRSDEISARNNDLTINLAEARKLIEKQAGKLEKIRRLIRQKKQKPAQEPESSVSGTEGVPAASYSGNTLWHDIQLARPATSGTISFGDVARLVTRTMEDLIFDYNLAIGGSSAKQLDQQENLTWMRTASDRPTSAVIFSQAGVRSSVVYPHPTKPRQAKPKKAKEKPVREVPALYKAENRIRNYR